MAMLVITRWYIHWYIGKSSNFKEFIIIFPVKLSIGIHCDITDANMEAPGPLTRSLALEFLHSAASPGKRPSARM